MYIFCDWKTCWYLFYCPINDQRRKEIDDELKARNLFSFILIKIHIKDRNENVLLRKITGQEYSV